MAKETAREREERLKQIALLALAGGAMLAGGGGIAMGGNAVARGAIGGSVSRGGITRAMQNSLGASRGRTVANQLFRSASGATGGNGGASGGTPGGKKKKARVDTPIEAAKRIAYLQRPPEPDYSNVRPGGLDYGVIYIPGEPQENALLNRGGEYDLALNLQTPEQHLAALNKYMEDERWDPDTCARMGEEYEKSIPEFNRHDATLRRPVNPSSSCISSIRVDGNNIICKFGSNPKEYIYGCKPYSYDGTFRDATEAVKELITSDSIGRAINPKTGWWRDKYHLN